ncbi:MAG: large conductance mechanosensitive channel protein MscL [Bariatricus sp.]|nr:large conductance mechanosensitive channel protein MscL [Bariatricus sp.]
MAKKGFIAEFKEFISRGNVMDMAVGVIIGGAFQSIVKSLVEDVVMPVITLATGGVDFSKWRIQLSQGEDPSFLNYGNFITAVINFLLMAFIIFCFVKFMNALSEKMIKKPAEAAPAPTTKKCPYCLSEIPIKATRCAHCTSELPTEEVKAE